jgi:5-methylcytosine-specific restriction endonuclease McrA
MSRAKRSYPKNPLGLKKTLETDFDEDGRVCTACGEYRIWEEFPVHSRSTTGRASQCRKCKAAKRRSKGRDIRKEAYCARKHKAKLKESDPYLVRARNIRSSLMNRARKLDLPRDEIPLAEDIKAWLVNQKPLECYYSKKPVDLWKCHIDHKTPLRRGGTNKLNNLCVTDAKVNSAKGMMTEREFKDLMRTVEKWEDHGEYIMSRLRMGHFGKIK